MSGVLDADSALYAVAIHDNAILAFMTNALKKSDKIISREIKQGKYSTALLLAKMLEQRSNKIKSAVAAAKEKAKSKKDD